MKKFLLSFVLIAFSEHSFAAKPIPDDVLVQIDKTTFFNFLNERVQHEVKTNVSLKEFRKSTEAFKVEFNKKTNKDAFFWYSADHKILPAWRKSQAVGFIPNSFAFDMILKNGYDISYQPQAFYTDSKQNYKDSYFKCEGDAARYVSSIVDYITNPIDSWRDNVELNKQQWDKQAKYQGTNIRQMCYPIAYPFVKDYEQFVSEYLSPLVAQNTDFLAREAEADRQAQIAHQQHEKEMARQRELEAEATYKADKEREAQLVREREAKKLEQAQRHAARLAAAVSRWEHLAPPSVLRQHLYYPDGLLTEQLWEMAIFLDRLNSKPSISLSRDSKTLVIRNSRSGENFKWTFEKVNTGITDIYLLTAWQIGFDTIRPEDRAYGHLLALYFARSTH